MKNKKLLIFGKGGHSRVVQDNLGKTKYKDIRLVDDYDLKNKDFVSIERFFYHYFPFSVYDAFVAIGDNYIREEKIKLLKTIGYNIPVIVSPSSNISKYTIIDSGCFIGPMTCINTDTFIRQGSIINTGATIDHDCHIQEYVHIAPGCHLCGSIEVGHHTLVGVGSSIIPKIKIASNIIIAGGSSINQNLDISKAVYAGNPIKFKKLITEIV